MRVKLGILTLLLLLGCGMPARAAQAFHTSAELLLSADTAKPGDTILAGLRLTMQPGWHTYWRNPGGPGIATSVKWDLPKGITAGEIQWPIPNKLEENNVTSYEYEGEVVLIVPLKIAADSPLGTHKLAGHLEWLECNSATSGAEKLVCIPGHGEVQASLAIGNETKPGDNAGLIEEWQKKLPRPQGEILATASWEKTAAGDTRPLLVEWSSAEKPAKADFYPYESEQFEVGSPVESVPAPAGKLKLRVPIRKLQPAGSWPTNVSGVLVQRSATNVVGYEVSLTPGAGESAPALAATATVNAGGGPRLGLIGALVSAFLGGLILNIMPCVLPVIALKILGFVSEAKNHPARVRFLGLVYAAGVIVSFLALAGVILVVQATGHKAGIGMQFNNPYFVIGMCILITLVALNLFGVFEITPGGKVFDAAGELASRHGTAGAFFNGMLATFLGTPCTAPILGPALGFALKHSPGTIVLIFLLVAIGMALPYLLLSWNPAWLRFLPKPGPWMVRFKVAMGFPMLATALWIFGLLPIFYGERAWWVAIFLLFLAGSAWIFGEFVQRGRSARGVGLAAAVACLLFGYFYALEGKTMWRSPISQTEKAQENETQVSTVHPTGADWRPWSEEAVAQARASGKPVVVDFTARWCVTCNTLVKPALEDEAVVKKLKEMGAVTLVGDYTRFPAAITEQLGYFGRAGVPLVVVYPGNPSAQPVPIPEPSPFSSYSKIILRHLEEAQKM